MAKDRSKVMCVPMDYAKNDHLVMFCNGNGRILRKPFSIKNSLEGKKYLIDQVKKSCQHHGISTIVFLKITFQLKRFFDFFLDYQLHRELLDPVYP